MVEASPIPSSNGQTTFSKGQTMLNRRTNFKSGIFIVSIFCIAILMSCSVVDNLTSIGQKRSSRKLTDQKWPPTFTIHTQNALSGVNKSYNAWLAEDSRPFQALNDPDLPSVLILPYEYFTESSTPTAEIVAKSPYYQKGKEENYDYALIGRINEVNLEVRGEEYRTSVRYRANITFYLEMVDFSSGKIINSGEYISDSHGIFDPTKPQGARIGFSAWQRSIDEAVVEALKRSFTHIHEFAQQRTN